MLTFKLKITSQLQNKKVVLLSQFGMSVRHFYKSIRFGQG